MVPMPMATKHHKAKSSASGVGAGHEDAGCAPQPAAAALRGTAAAGDDRIRGGRIEAKVPRVEPGTREVGFLLICDASTDLISGYMLLFKEASTLEPYTNTC